MVTCFVSLGVPIVNILLIEINTFIPAAVPISLAYIAAYARSRGFGAKVLSIGEGTPFSLRRLHRTLEEYKPRLVGFPLISAIFRLFWASPVQ